MRGRKWVKGVLTGLAGAATGVACAFPTGLMVIPIADILGHGEVLYLYGFVGNERNIDKGYLHSHGVEIGLADRFEVGFDNDLRGATTLNAKVLLLDDKKDGRYALSFGLLNLGDRSGDMYLVGRYNLSPTCRLHAGYMQTGDNRLIAGADGPVPWKRMADCTWSVEHISGEGSQTWFSLSVPVKQVPGLSAMVGVGFPGQKATGIQHSLVVSYGFRI